MIKPSDSQIHRYSNIEKYYDFYIKETMNVNQKNVRSNYKIIYNVKLDDSTNKIVANGSFSYRVYPSENGYNPIKVGFLSNDKCSKINKISIYNEIGEIKTLANSDLQNFVQNNDEQVASIDIQEFGKDSDHLDIEIRTEECGSDHWMAVNYKALQPTDGFSFDLHCTGDINIKKFFIFGAEHSFHIDKADDDKNLTLACHQWINEGTGVIVVVSTTQYAD